MPDIKFVCDSCQQPLEAPEAMAGESVECPSCEKPITIPAMQPATRVAPNVCPECGKPMEVGVVLCVNCGFHQGLGKKLSTDFL